MEVSSTAPAKGSSDFSIARILSDTPRSEERPSWLCCTRYQPPKLPRPSTSGRCRRSGRHARVPFSAAQAAALEAAYARAQYLAPPALRALASALHLRDDRIKIWFQNRRARDRREKTSTILPPHAAVALPATQTARWCTSPLKVQTENVPECSLTRAQGMEACKNDIASDTGSLSDDGENVTIDIESVNDEVEVVMLEG